MVERGRPLVSAQDSLQRTHIGLGAVKLDTSGRLVLPERPRSASAATMRYLVRPGAVPGEIVLTALAEGEAPPFCVPVVTIAPSCEFDERAIDTMLTEVVR
jgi:hypothetical protein